MAPVKLICVKQTNLCLLLNCENTGRSSEIGFIRVFPIFSCTFSELNYPRAGLTFNLSGIYMYRSGTVNSRSFVGKVLLWNK